LRALNELVGTFIPPSVNVYACDGDTSNDEREEAKARANIILTNPDMLHVTLLPLHEKWSRIFKNLKYVVVDEAHTYRGVFGAHVSGVIRRLVRVCAQYGSLPQFICCSVCALSCFFSD
jgi:DEAD/DEAH box helicase domain-containing protein